ncbi:hypothetical protein OAF80_00320 [bacterium]|nr:hypothetical protein [bacterium]
MNGIDLIKYGAFGFSFLVGLSTFALSDDLRNPEFFKKCLIAAVISLAIGILLELTNTLNLNRGMAILLMSISIIYLGYYRLLMKLFRSWKGTDPYITSASSSIGETPLDGLWTKYPKGRKIMWTDFLFSFAQALVPIFTIMGLLFLIVEINR